MRVISLFLLKWVLIPLAILTIFNFPSAEETQPTSQPLDLDFIFNQVLQWSKNQIGRSQESGLNLGFHSIIAGVLYFLAASISSVGVISGALFLPILILVAGLDLKNAATFSAFLVTGGAASHVLYNLFFKDSKYGGKSLIDYDTSLLLSEPGMLLGVTIGVICNVIFPGWPMTLIFVLLLAFSSYKACWGDVLCWKAESDEVGRIGLEGGKDDRRINVGEDENGMGEKLLEGKTDTELGIPVKKMVVLLMVWLSFYVMNVLRGDGDGEYIDLRQSTSEAPVEGEVTGRLWDEMSQKIVMLRQRLQELLDAKEWCDEHHVLIGESSAGPSSSSGYVERDWKAEVEATRRQLADTIGERDELVLMRQAREKRIADLEAKLQEVTNHEAELEARLAPFVDQPVEVTELRLRLADAERDMHRLTEEAKKADEASKELSQTREELASAREEIARLGEWCQRLSVSSQVESTVHHPGSAIQSASASHHPPQLLITLGDTQQQLPPEGQAGQELVVTGLSQQILGPAVGTESLESVHPLRVGVPHVEQGPMDQEESPVSL